VELMQQQMAINSTAGHEAVVTDQVLAAAMHCPAFCAVHRNDTPAINGPPQHTITRRQVNAQALPAAMHCRASCASNKTMTNQSSPALNSVR
jgi:hypothetical protein